MYKRFGKRFIDIILSGIGIIIIFPVCLIVSIAILLEDGGPVLYCGERLGKNGTKFKMYKFRSMYKNAPDLRNNDGSTYNAIDDPRVTKVGHFLRETSIDELPQLFNVLKGEMSLIGPRASVGDSLTGYAKDELGKLTVRPGITGYVQAYYRNGLTVHEKRLQDVWYAQNISLVLDIKIIIKTISTVLL